MLASLVFRTSAGVRINGKITLPDVDKADKHTGALCTEMEGAAIAQICILNNIPFLVIRSISDIPNGKNQIDFNEYLKLASKNCAEFIKQI